MRFTGLCAEREGFYTTLPSSVTRWYSSAVFRHFRLFCTKNGAELAQDKTSLNTVYEWLSLHNLTILRNLSTLFSTPLLKSLRRLWHYDTRFLLSSKSVAIVFCLSSHCLCIMFMNCPYERGIILHHDHYLTIIIQIPIIKNMTLKVVSSCSKIDFQDVT